MKLPTDVTSRSGIKTNEGKDSEDAVWIPADAVVHDNRQTNRDIDDQSGLAMKMSGVVIRPSDAGTVIEFENRGPTTAEIEIIVECDW